MTAPLGICALCGNNAELRGSHLIPKFVGEWIKRTSATGYLRQIVNPKARRQDIAKQRLLCEDCEQLFSAWEKSFAEQVFRPHHDGIAVYVYDEWLLNFAISLAWRTISVHMELIRTTKPAPLIKCAEDAMSSWTKYLLGQTTDPGPYEHHILFIDKTVNVSESVPVKFHSYIFRAVDQTVASSDSVIYAYTKLPGIIFWTAIKPSTISGWQNTKIDRKGQIIFPQVVEDGGFVDFLTDRIETVYANVGPLSADQRAKIVATM